MQQGPQHRLGVFAPQEEPGPLVPQFCHVLALSVGTLPLVPLAKRTLRRTQGEGKSHLLETLLFGLPVNVDTLGHGLAPGWCGRRTPPRAMPGIRARLEEGGGM